MLSGPKLLFPGTLTAKLELTSPHSVGLFRSNRKGSAVSEQSREQKETDETSRQESPAKPKSSGSLTVEDDADGTVNAADLAGSATADDAQLGPAANEADGR